MLAVMDVIPEEQPTPRWVALDSSACCCEPPATGFTR
jgi:hypothetical protein